MKKLIVFLMLALPFACLAEAFQSTLLVQTGKLREADLIVRIVTDLESNKTCLAFYIRTTGTSPVMNCYDARSGFRSNLNQVGHFKEGKLVVRKLKDSINDVACLVAYVSTPGTSPSIACYQSRKEAKNDLVRSGHLREGDLDVYKIVDADSTETCLIAYVTTGGTSPTLTCYTSKSQEKAGMVQSASMREGDLIVRKIVDQSNRKECLIGYVSTEGTSPYIYCSDGAFAGQPAARESRPAAVSPASK